MKVKFIDLSRVNYKEYKKSIKKVFKTGMFILGEEVTKFEKSISNILNRYVVGVSSGTDALITALKGYNIGVGDEVIIPNISYIATANSVSFVGANPVFCDVEDDFNINPKKIEKLITSKTKAIIIVHYGGKIGKIKKIQQIAKKHNLILIEDSAQAFMAKKHNKYAGTFGDIGCFSLNPMKIFGAFGEAGMIVTSNKKIYKKLILIRNNGVNHRKKTVMVGYNAKIDTIQAAILNQKLKKVKDSIKKRQQIAKKYNKALKKFVKTPKFSKNNVYFTYTILTNKRDELYKFLQTKNIEAKIYHTALTLEKPYKHLHNKNLKNSVKLSNMKLALPCNEYLTDKEVKYIIKTIKEFFNV